MSKGAANYMFQATLSCCYWERSSPNLLLPPFFWQFLNPLPTIVSKVAFSRLNMYCSMFTLQGLDTHTIVSTFSLSSSPEGLPFPWSHVCGTSPAGSSPTIHEENGALQVTMKEWWVHTSDSHPFIRDSGAFLETSLERSTIALKWRCVSTACTHLPPRVT